MGAQHSRLQKRSLYRRFSRHDSQATTVIAPPGEPERAARPKLKSSMQALGQGMDRETAEALVHETLHLTMDLQQVHQQLNEVLKMKSTEQIHKRMLLPQFSFELRPVTPLLSDIHPAHRTSVANDLSVCQSAVRPVDTSVDVSMRTTSHDEDSESLPSLAACSTFYSCPSSSAQSPPLPLSRLSLQQSQAVLNRHDSILAPAIALCDELLDQSLLSLGLLEDVKPGLRRGRKGELPINPVGRPEDGRIVAVRIA